MRTTRPVRGRVVGALVAALALLATGCADRGGSSEPATGADAMTLNVGQISDSAAFFPLYVAEQQGYFKDEGLTLGDRPRLGTGAKLAAALQSGSIDVAGGVMTDAFNLYKINADTRLVGSLVNSYYVDIVAGPNIPSSLDDAPLADRVDALKGKKIGITGPGSGTEALVVYLLKQQGLSSTEDVTLVNLGADPSAAVGALKAGQVDALSFFQPIGQQAEATDVGRIFISPARGDVPELQNDVHGVVFTTQEVIDSKGKAVAAFLRAIARAEEFIGGDAADVQEQLQSYQGTLNPDTVSALVPVLQGEIPTDPTVTEAAYKISADFHKASGLIESPPAYADIVPADWIAKALAG